jgi:galactose oxidase
MLYYILHSICANLYVCCVEFGFASAEIWDPATETFTLLEAKHQTPRTYHSVGVLLPDGRVFTGGGGLCGARCDVNHLDAEIFNPPYLFDADGKLAPRPNITISSQIAINGASLQVTASEQLMMVSMIRMGTATHSVNTDQRRIELCGPFTSPCSVSPVTVTIPLDPGVALAGYWMVFGVNAAGTPSLAATLLVGAH